MQILIPMCGLGTRFSNAGYTDPKPFIQFLGKTMIEHVIENIGYHNRFVLVMLELHYANYNHVIKDIEQRCQYPIKIAVVSQVTQGPADSCLQAAQLIDHEESLMIANCDQIFDWNQADLEHLIKTRQELSGVIFVFTAPNNPESYSYAAVDHQGYVTQTAEKQVISPHATTGIYTWFRAGDFFDNARRMMQANDRVNNEFYVAPVYSYAIAQGLRFGIWRPIYHIPIGTPTDLDQYVDAVNSKLLGSI